MIYTVTLNPAIDWVADVKDFRTGEVNRSEREQIFPGGKGINVSLVLKNLGVESVALGFLAGFTGAEIERMVRERGVRSEFTRLPGGLSRINGKIRSGGETAVNGRGPDVPEESRLALLKRLDALEDGDILVLSGSIPGTLPADTYETILRRLERKRIRTVVDASGEALLRVLRYRPFLIKPNREELAELFPAGAESAPWAAACAKTLQERGARNVLVSLGAQGALLLDETGVLRRSPAPKGRAINTVGAGDSMVAGFLAGYLPGADFDRAFRTGLAAGSASAFSEELATGEQIAALLEKLSERT